MPLPRPEHGDIALELGSALRVFAKANKVGRAFGNDTGFQLNKPGEPHTVLSADVAFVRAQRVPPKDDPSWQLYFPFAPDLVVEIASPSQYRPVLAAKTRRWLAAGTRLVWVVWPARHRIDIWHPGRVEQDASLGVGDSLDGEDVLPGFRYPVADLFA
jgi:Uma2 family endonuclease